MAVFSSKSIPIWLPFLGYLLSALVLLFYPSGSFNNRVGETILFVVYSYLVYVYAVDIVHAKTKHIDREYFKKSFKQWNKRVAFWILGAHYGVAVAFKFLNLHMEWQYIFGSAGYILMALQQVFWASVLLTVFFVVSTYVKLLENEQFHIFYVLAKAIFAGYYISMVTYLH